ncbi:GNAT family N-acetyltransferase [Noviherbaspirillum galbum]|uniref:GNAT family N-acetyltransferase n=1 Tax=Noviherbaspirillum galbum TaxID=2709383 RepID=A0A6B3SYN1_9BURK|nr:GNAT family N-acetyltransferase [Noviherbaspirillum galbum]NEX63902.1 GNAT family N-acetyltransferase [Noviherbaspirillum galbum]
MLTIRPAAAGDLPSIRALLDANALPSDDITAGHLAHFIVLSQTSRVLGAVGLEADGSKGTILSLAVEPSMHSRGLGSRLLELIESHAREAGIDDLYLLPGTAGGFFRMYGYEPAERDAVPAGLQSGSGASLSEPAAAMFKRLD